MKHRAMAMLAGLLLVSQVSTQPVAAAEHRAETPTVFADSEREPRSPNTPGGLNQSGSFAAPTPDLKVELVSGWWVGNERHSKFKISNVGSGPAPNAYYRFHLYSYSTINPVLGSIHLDTVQLGNMPAGASLLVVVACKPQPDYICRKNRMDAKTDASDSNPANNFAEDNIHPSLTS